MVHADQKPVADCMDHPGSRLSTSVHPASVGCTKIFGGDTLGYTGKILGIHWIHRQYTGNWGSVCLGRGVGVHCAVDLSTLSLCFHAGFGIDYSPGEHCCQQLPLQGYWLHQRKLWISRTFVSLHGPSLLEMRQHRKARIRRETRDTTLGYSVLQGRGVRDTQDAQRHFFGMHTN